MPASSPTINSNTPYQVAGRVVRDSQLPELLRDEMRSRGHSFADVSAITGIERSRLHKIATNQRPVAPVRNELLMYIFNLPRVSLEPAPAQGEHLRTLDRLANIVQQATDLSRPARDMLLATINYLREKEGG